MPSGRKSGPADQRCPTCDQPVPPAKFAEIAQQEAELSAKFARLQELKELAEAAREAAQPNYLLDELFRGRTGRPPKPPTPGERISLGLKVTAEIKARLDKAAKESGRTQSQEAEARIERSFDRQDLLPEVLTLAYGREAAGLLMMVGLIMKTVGDHYHMRKRVAGDGPRWTDDAVALGNVAHAVLALLDAAKPSDQSVNPDTGLDCASQLISSVANPTRKGRITWDHQQTEVIRSLLGPTMDRMIKAAGRRRLSVLDSDAQARELQIAVAAEAVRCFFLAIYEPLDVTVGDMLRRPSDQELFEVLVKGLTGRPMREEIHEIVGRYKRRVSRKED